MYSSAGPDRYRKVEYRNKSISVEFAGGNSATLKSYDGVWRGNIEIAGEICLRNDAADDRAITEHIKVIADEERRIHE